MGKSMNGSRQRDLPVAYIVAYIQSEFSTGRQSAGRDVHGRHLAGGTRDIMSFFWRLRPTVDAYFRLPPWAVQLLTQREP